MTIGDARGTMDSGYAAAGTHGAAYRHEARPEDNGVATC